MGLRFHIRHTGNEPKFQFEIRKVSKGFVNIYLPGSLFIAIRTKRKGEYKSKFIDLGFGRSILEGNRLRKRGYFQIRCIECGGWALKHSSECSRDAEKLIFY